MFGNDQIRAQEGDPGVELTLNKLITDAQVHLQWHASIIEGAVR